MKKIKITKWGTCKFQCVKAIKNLMGLSLIGAKDVVYNSEIPCVLRVCDDEKLKTFKDYTQTCCSGINYTVEDDDRDVDAPNEETSEDYSDETLLAISKIEEGQKYVGEAKQIFLAQIRFLNTSLKGVVNHKEKLLEKNKELGDRYNKVCAEANMLQAEVEKLKANNNNDLCIQLREEIARLRYDNDTLRKDKKVVESKNDNLTAANKCFEDLVDQLNKEKEDIELENKRLRDANQNLSMTLATIKEVVIRTIS